MGRLVCGNTIGVSTCQVDFVLWRNVFLYILLPRSRFLEFERLLSSKKNVCPAFFNYYSRLKVENQPSFLLELVVDHYLHSLPRSEF